MSVLPILVALIAAASAILIVRGLIPAESELNPLEARLQKFKDAEQPFANLSEVELSLPFFERVIQPGLDRLGRRLAARMPATSRQALQDQLDLAGRPLGLSVGGYQAMRIISFLLVVGIAVLIANLLQVDSSGFALTVVFGVVGGILPPRMVISRAVKKRQHEILLSLPSSLDLLTISVEAGLVFDAAMQRVTEKYKNALTREFVQFLNEVQLGRSRGEALDAITKRTGVDELNNFFQAIMHSEQLGVGMASLLRIQSEELRRKRRQRAEEQGQKAPLKMLFPLVGCIFPTLFVVLFGPAALQVTSGFSGK